MLRSNLPDADLEAMQRLIAYPYLADAQRGCLHFGMAEALDARGAYIEAAEHLNEANGIASSEWAKRGQSYDPLAHREHVDQLCSTFTPAYFERTRGMGSESHRPIFIVGLPRSGTTLTEQILAAHSQVFGAGELRFGHDDFGALSEEVDASPLEVLERLDGATVERVAARHLERLRELDADSPRIADKLPDNYLYLGLLATLFPRARFIHCRRDLRDVAVSCWMTNFRQIRWASDQEHIASRFGEYRRIMEHWRKVLPVKVLEVDYEETVADLEGVARRLVSFCGLDWEPACLDFHKANRPVRTASVAQVRQPIYTRSVARWRNYEPALGTLFERLAHGVGV